MGITIILKRKNHKPLKLSHCDFKKMTILWAILSFSSSEIHQHLNKWYYRQMPRRWPRPGNIDPATSALKMRDSCHQSAIGDRQSAGLIQASSTIVTAAYYYLINLPERAGMRLATCGMPSPHPLSPPLSLSHPNQKLASNGRCYDLRYGGEASSDQQGCHFAWTEIEFPNSTLISPVEKIEEQFSVRVWPDYM